MKKITSLSLALVLASSLVVNSPVAANATTAPLQQTTTKSAVVSNSYQLIRNALLANEQFGQFDPSEIKSTDVGSLIQKVVRENPEILYYKSAKVWTSGKIEFIYYLPTDTMKKNRLALNTKVEQVLKTIIKPGFTELDKVKAVHDYIALNAAYDIVNQQKKAIPADSYTAHGALVKGLAVCDGYTKAAQLLLNKLGIENNYVVGTIKDGLHSWNQVKVNGNYYFMDITWDDPAPNKPGQVRYNYFLVTSDQLKKDHTWDMKNWPVATSNQYNYYHDLVNPVQWGNALYFSNQADNYKLYQMTKDGKNMKKVNDVRAPQFVISGDWIYFSNFSNRGYLYKMKTNGANLQQVNKIYSVDFVLNGTTLSFTDKNTSKQMKIAVASK